jgi:hypothetical protein
MLLRREQIRIAQEEILMTRHREARTRREELLRRTRNDIWRWSTSPSNGDRFLFLPRPVLFRNWFTFDCAVCAIQTATYKDELLETWKKFQTIQNCKAIKEELMMNRWHPSRVEKMMDAGLLENML